ncbi:MAG: hypothetical protein WBQ73_00210 [Candidatus Babeliales bacterium]
MKRNGFQGIILLEVMVYCFLAFFLLVMMLLVYGAWCRTVMVLQNKYMRMIASCGTRDMLYRLARAMPGNSEHWKKRTKEELIWYVDKDLYKGIGKKGREIYLYEGVYDQSAKKWITVSKSCLLSNCVQFECKTIQQGNSITTVIFTLQGFDEAKVTVEAHIRNVTL